MTRKAIEKKVDAIITAVAAAHGLDLANRKGIEPEVLLTNGKVYEALSRLEAVIVAATNPPTA